jgi:predicted outer membrane protein
MKEAAAAEARRLHEDQLRAAQEAVRQLIEQNRPRVEKREQLLQEKEDRRRQREVRTHVMSALCAVLMLLSLSFAAQSGGTRDGGNAETGVPQPTCSTG